MDQTKLVPGFRFHPTDVELVKFYLKRKVLGKKIPNVISELDIYKFAPWDLPDKSCFRTGDLKWYFLCPIEKKYASGARLNRATECGYWKTTGRDRPVEYNNEVVGMIKTLIFHQGRAPKGERTDWVMHEYRLEDKDLLRKGIPQDGYVLCVIFQKDGPGPRNGKQYGTPFDEQQWDDDNEDVDKVVTPPCVTLPAVPATPECGSSGSSCISCITGDLPPSNMLPTVSKSVSVIKDIPEPITVDDIFSMSSYFPDDNVLFLNKGNNNKETDDSGHVIDGGAVPCLDVNDIFKDLGNLNNLDGHSFHNVHNDDYLMNISINDSYILKLSDLENPMPWETQSLGHSFHYGELNECQINPPVNKSHVLELYDLETQMPWEIQRLY